MSLIPKFIQKKQGIRRYVGPKRIVILIVLAALVTWAWNYHGSGALSPAVIGKYREAHPILSIALFILIYAVSVIASLPSLPLNLAAGFFWGGVMGGVYATVGVTAGGWVSFAVARWLVGQPLAEQFDNRLARKVQQEFERDGWKFVAFARLNPAIPTGLLNYALGLTSLTTSGFLWATFVFLLPPSIAVAYIGDTLNTFAVQESGAGDIVTAVIAVSAAVTFLVAIKFASKLIKNNGFK